MTCKVVAMIAALPACHRASPLHFLFKTNTRNYTDSLSIFGATPIPSVELVWRLMPSSC